MASIPLNTATDGMNPGGSVGAPAPAAPAPQSAAAAASPSLPVVGEPAAPAAPAGGPPIEYDGADRGFLEKAAKDLETPKDDPPKEPEAKPESKAEAKPADDPAPEKKDPPKPDDADPEIDALEPAQGAHKKTTENFAKLKHSAKEARRELKTANEELLRLRSEVETAKKSGGEIPEAVKAQLTQAQTDAREARERLRILDVQQDPEFVSTFDAPMQRKQKDMADFLLELGRTEQQVDAYRKGGFSVPTIMKDIKILEDTGTDDNAAAAFKLRGLLQDHESLKVNRAAKLDEWKTDGDARRTKQLAEQQDRQTKMQQESDASFATSFEADRKALATKLPFLAEATEPAVQAKVDNRMKSIMADLRDPAKAAAAGGQVRALMAQGILLGELYAPRIEKFTAPLQNRVKELEAEIAKTRKAGTMGQGHTPPPVTPGKPKGPAFDSKAPEGSFLRGVAEQMGAA